jgi:hypothetical protein
LLLLLSLLPQAVAPKGRHPVLLSSLHHQEGSQVLLPQAHLPLPLQPLLPLLLLLLLLLEISVSVPEGRCHHHRHPVTDTASSLHHLLPLPHLWCVLLLLLLLPPPGGTV